MKSCPKCNRTFPDEGQKFCTFDGGLLITPQTFDPNATIRATSSDLVPPPPEKTTSRELPDPNATIVESYAETVALPRNTGPTGGAPNTADFTGKTQVDNPTQAVFSSAAPQPPPSTPPSPAPQPTSSLPPSTPRPTSQPLDPAATLVSVAPTVTAPPVQQAQPPKKKSKLPWIIAGVLVFLLLGGGALVAAFFVVVKPMLDQKRATIEKPSPTPAVAETNTASPSPTEAPSPSPTDSFVPPPNTTQYVSSNTGLDGKLAEHYFDFSFYYPDSWKKDPAGASSFVGVGRKVDDFPQESFTVGWYTSTGTFIGDLPTYPKRVEELSGAFEKQFPDYKKISEGPTTINSMQGYEFRWEGLSTGTKKGDVHLWGRVVFLPTGNEGDTTGATLTMFATSLADELSSVNDVGDRGQMPVILESFRFGKRK